ncbi:hypothetical protein CHELA1G11_21506 [Hyphomicrobiales bacterium]|nr:hypothetical protein CHELA1G11_21506 [Hyphomicrobiales bacterium]CAH1694874.1 hypothetical protein CHELA1G2_21812 [Hyphomicrobiales bacterium]
MGLRNWHVKGTVSVDDRPRHAGDISADRMVVFFPIPRRCANHQNDIISAPREMI